MKHTYGKFLTAALAVLTLVATGSCTSEILPDFCSDGILLKVEVAASANVEDDDISENDISNVSLYVFDDDETLLEIIPTEVGRTEVISHKGTAKFHVVAIANLSQCHMPELVCGTSKVGHGEVCLTGAGSQYDGLDISETPDDLFWGSVDIENNPQAAGGTIGLPIKRMIAGVYIRVKNLRRQAGNMQATDGQFRVVMGTPHDKLDFRGQAGCTTRATADPVNHLFDGQFRDISGGEYFEIPGQNTVTKAAEYQRILATEAGSAVTLSIYHNGTLVTDEPITTDKDGNPLTVRNAKLNTISVFFGDEGAVEVTVNESAWGSAPPIIKEF